MISLEKAKKALELAEKKAQELNVSVSIAVVDEYGVLIAFSRMEGAIKISPKFAFAKAYTAGTIGLATQDMAAFATDGKPYYDINSLFGGELTTIAGGIPLIIEGKLAGAIGVGGSMDVSQDHACAQAGSAAIV